MHPMLHALAQLRMGPIGAPPVGAGHSTMGAPAPPSGRSAAEVAQIAAPYDVVRDPEFAHMGLEHDPPLRAFFNKLQPDERKLLLHRMTHTDLFQKPKHSAKSGM